MLKGNHSDALVKEGHWPGIQYPRVPGHEVVGVVDAVGAGVAQWKPGQRVGVAGMAVTVAIAMRVAAVISSAARWRSRSLAFPSTAVMRIT
jgi:D-arabinose 1-dehydrogenase-like Zn-dependent alcohol dehydrogenase